MGTQIDVSPTRSDGTWKSGEEVFLEVFNHLKSKGISRRDREDQLSNQSMDSKTLAEKMIESYGADWVGWLPETIRQQLSSDFGEIPENIIQKIFAIKTMLSNDDFWNNVYIFQNIILALNDVYPDFSSFQEISPAQVVYGILESKKIRDFEFDDIVKAYIRNILFDNGLFVCPPELRFLGLDMAYNIAIDDNAEDVETFEGIQSAKVGAIKIYLEEKNNG